MNEYYIKIYNHKFLITPSKRKNKKYDVYELVDDEYDYLLSFGDNRYSHYEDKLGYYKNLNHLDEDRLMRYYKRHGYTDDYRTAKFWSNYILW